jgi:hypothetical protein
MSGCKFKISLVIAAISLFSVQAFSQQINYGDSLTEYNYQKANLKPSLHYSVGSSFMFSPHSGSVAGLTVSPYLSIPLSPKWSVDGGLIAGRYYSTSRNFDPEIPMNGAFNDLSIYGSASYHVNTQLTLYGSGIKQLAGSSPFLPKSSYSVGSIYNFGSFSIGVAVKVSKWDNSFSSFPINGSQGFYSPFEQRPGTFTPFGP